MGLEEDGHKPLGVMAPRLAGWRPRLDAVIEAANVASWSWGEHDCLAFAAKSVMAVTGEDLFEPYREKYRDEAGAKRLVPDVALFMDELAEREGWPPIQAGAAQDGDLALFDHGLPIVGVIYARLLFPKNPAGLRNVSRFIATKVWAVG